MGGDVTDCCNMKQCLNHNFLMNHLSAKWKDKFAFFGPTLLYLWCLKRAPLIQMDLNYRKEGYFGKKKNDSDYVTYKFIMQHLLDFGNTRCVHSNDFAVILTNFHFKIHLKFKLQSMPPNSYTLSSLGEWGIAKCFWVHTSDTLGFLFTVSLSHLVSCIFSLWFLKLIWMAS